MQYDNDSVRHSPHNIRILVPFRYAPSFHVLSASKTTAQLIAAVMSLYPSYPPALTPEQATYLTTLVKEWSAAHGLMVRPAPAVVAAEHDPHQSLATTAPVTLFPSLFPLQCYHEALMIQTAYNELYANVAKDEEWLGEMVDG